MCAKCSSEHSSENYRAIAHELTHQQRERGHQPRMAPDLHRNGEVSPPLSAEGNNGDKEPAVVIERSQPRSRIQLELEQVPKYA